MFGAQKVSDGQSYEKFVATELKRIGYHKIEFTAVTGDYGVDLLAECDGYRYAIQCKYYSEPVGISAVQEAVAGLSFYDCDRAMVVTNNTLTKAARELAEANEVDIIEELMPEKLSFWERRQPWELIVLAIECLVFGLVLYQMLLQQTVSVRSVGILLLICFPLPFLIIRALIRLLPLIHRITRGNRQ